MQVLFVPFLVFVLCWSVFGLIVGLFMVLSSQKVAQKQLESRRGKVKMVTSIFTLLVSVFCLWFVNSDIFDGLIIVPIAFLIGMPELLASYYFMNKKKQLTTNN